MQACIACRLRFMWVSSAPHGLKADTRPDPPFDATAILLNPIAQVAALEDANQSQLPSFNPSTQLFASQNRIASQYAWLPMITFLSGRPCRLSTLRRNRLAAARLRRRLSQNSIALPFPSIVG